MKYDYLIEKILDAKFVDEPFPHIYIEEFLSVEDLDLLTTCDTIKFKEFENTEELISTLKKSYTIQEFPGCKTSVKEYLDWFYNRTDFNINNREIVEGFGMVWKLNDEKSKEIHQLKKFLNSDKFKQALHQKFEINVQTRIYTVIQKYLTGYEISPHPDIRQKMLTYLININTEEIAEKMDIHTHLLKFKPDYQHIQKIWKEHTNLKRFWVPWDWCETKRIINKNNSLVMFKPGNDTLHAVKLDYDHLKLQRTQIYGNLYKTEYSGITMANHSNYKEKIT